jgi:hypothetical protein
VSPPGPPESRRDGSDRPQAFAAALPVRMPADHLRALMALGVMYPGWRYELCDQWWLPRWWAIRYSRPTHQEHQAGVREAIGRTSAERLAEALADQCGRIRMNRYR